MLLMPSITFFSSIEGLFAISRLCSFVLCRSFCSSMTANSALVRVLGGDSFPVSGALDISTSFFFLFYFIYFTLFSFYFFMFSFCVFYLFFKSLYFNHLLFFFLSF